MRSLAPAFIVLLTASPAAAQVAGAEPSVPEAESSTVTPAAPASAVEASAEPSPPAELRTRKRPVPDLDGRPPEPPDAGDVLIWVPRALLSPIHLVLEWGIRQPLGALLTEAERGNWAAILVDFFTFDDRRIGVVPTFFLDFNFRPSVGLYMFWNELFVKEHGVRLAVGWGGDRWYRLTFLDRWTLSTSTTLDFAFNLWGRPDYIYAGEGLAADPDARSRYFEEHYGGEARLLVRPWRGSELRIEAGVRHHRFRDGLQGFDGELTLRERLAPEELPEAFLGGYLSSFQRALLRLDTRQHRPSDGSGLLLEGTFEHAWDVERPRERQWYGVGGTAGAFLDVGRHRVLGLLGQVHLVNPLLEGRDIPFTELFVLGRRPNDLSGFLPGVLRGRSAAVVTLEYTYPIWVFLDGAFNFSVGNAFDPNFEGFDVGALRSSIGLGVRAIQNEDNPFSFLLAVGTSRFDERFAIDSFRLAVGTQTGF